jgi:glycosyltransferase involved in cell wall biosynthesis
MVRAPFRLNLLRIAVIETAPFGGLLHYAVQLGDALAAGGDDVDLIVPADHELSGRTGPARRLEVLPARRRQAEDGEGRLATFRRRAGTALWRVASWREIIGRVRRGRYDVVILNGSIDLSLSAAGAYALVRLSRGAKVTHVCHNVRPFNRWAGSDLFASSKLLFALLRRVYPAFALVFVHGPRSREDFDRSWPGARLAEIPHGDEGIFTEAEAAPAPAAEPRVLFFGDWRRVKGLPVLMEAFDLLLARRPDARLTIAGSPSPEEGVDKEVMAWAAARPDAVEVLAGYVPVQDVPAVFGRARVVAMPYLVGYQSGVVHLAMTMARAVVATDVGDLPEAVQDGVTGTIVAPGDAAALADALDAILGEPDRAQAMGAAGRERMLGASSWSSVAEQVDAALAQLA